MISTSSTVLPMSFTDGLDLGRRAARRLAALRCCEIEPGLTEAEFSRIERDYGIEFADDHRAFLADGLPVGQPREEGQTWDNPWPDWRNGSPDELIERLSFPVDMLLNDVRYGHWRAEWGARPEEPEEAVMVASRGLTNAPRLIPIFAHRFLPAGHGKFGYPVLSMRGVDIICYGSNLLDYINQEFQEPRPEYESAWPHEIILPFWQDYLRSY